MSAERVNIIEQRITKTLQPADLQVIDESHLHAGHAGARGGAGHYRAIIVSEAFSGKNLIARHRLVYALFADMMPQEIHALSLDCKTPDEMA